MEEFKVNPFPEPQGQILDRTGQNIGDPESEFEDLSPDLIEVDYTNTRLRTLPPMKHLIHLKNLNLRKNLLDYHVLGDLKYLTSLVSLDLYDNRLTSSALGLENCTNLVNLDLSFNLIPSMEPMPTLVNLRELWYANNEISKIISLENCTNLITLELGANKIKKIANLEKMVVLKNLWLGKNRIRRIENLDNLKNLEILDLQVNRLTSIINLFSLEKLKQLYLAHNRIEKIENLEKLTNLQILDISNNRLKKIENLETLVLLEDLWLNGNFFESFEEIDNLLPLKMLSTLYLEGSPMSKDLQYRQKIISKLPKLVQLDAIPVVHSAFSDILRKTNN